MTVETPEQLTLKILQQKATQLRIDSVRATTEAGSGRPTSCASAAEIMSVPFYSVMHYDPHADPIAISSCSRRVMLLLSFVPHGPKR